MDGMSEMIIKLLLSALLGGLIGLERELHSRAAGLRTHILVAVGSTLIMMVSNYMFFIYQDQTASTVVRLDPARIAAMTITGIGFLGAGTIIQSKEIVRGLTTAACLWVIAAVGLAVGCGFYLPAVLTSFIALIALYLLHYFEDFLKRDWYRKLVVTTDDGDRFSAIEQVLAGNKITILKVGLDTDTIQKETTFHIDIKMKKDLTDFTISRELVKTGGIRRVQWL
ncbi:MAG: MgtC/SapB family protein [Thermodesulfobacteriota bacterium]|nr:MgtC/SapB family protein [Thermodesulfobacteriota bacterium]